MNALQTYWSLISGNFQDYKWQILSCFSAILGLYLTKKLYIAGGVCKSKVRLDGKTVIITGANTGIGKETALDLAKRGARVIMACRDIKKSIIAAEEIRRTSGNGNVIVEYLDLASLKSIRKFADKMISQEEKIHILINNAGIMACPKSKTVDGFETQFGVNHIGHFYLTNLLLDRIKKSAPSRIVVVSALAHEWARLDFDDLQSENNYEPWKVYQKTKLANVLFTLELAKRLSGTGVTVNALHPGVIRTELSRHFAKAYGLFYGVVLFLLKPFQYVILKNPTEGAQTTIYCAIEEELDNKSGRYFSDCKEKALKPHASNDNDAQRLWKISEEILNQKLNSI